MSRIKIDGTEYEIEQGLSVLDVARANDIWIPSLCHHPSLSSYGACRLCLIEIVRKGRTRVTAACTLPATDGLEIITRSERLDRLRRIVMELILASCPNSDSIVKLAEKLGVHQNRLETLKANDCVLCGLCVRACREISQTEAISFANRGVERKVITPFGKASHRCVLCGACVFVCPTGSRLLDLAKISGETPRALTSKFDAGLATVGAISRPFPQAVPNVPVINPTACLKLNRDACGICEKVCEARAIVYKDTDKTRDIRVGAIIAVPGFETFVPNHDFGLGYGSNPDVVTSMEFERFLSASGPFGGHIHRPSDGQEPRRIAFLQCVGSRDISCRNGYCSSVCCMYAVKEAIIAREHISSIEPTIFVMDVRAFGKDFDRFVERAKSEYGIGFVYARVADVIRDRTTGQTDLIYADPAGRRHREKFDLVVLSVGMEPSENFRELTRNLGVRLNRFGFVWTDAMSPLCTSRAGVFAAGAASGPKDIPETVIQAGAAACEAGRLLRAARGTLTVERTFPPERDVAGEPPRIGVFVCHCGINIGGVVAVPDVVAHVKKLPNVVYAEENLYTCSQDSQTRIRDLIREHNLNRVVVASCSPRTHEPLFQQTLREAGLNPHLFEMANIRDQCSWIHMNEPAAATVKAKSLAAMAVAKVTLAESLVIAEHDVTPSALVIGAGLAGMTSALAVADQGFDVTLIEREKQMGGNLAQLQYTFDEPDIPAYLKRLGETVRRHKRITVRAGAELVKVEGFVGNFQSTLQSGKKLSKLKHGVIIVATGGREHKPDEYRYGRDRRVLTQLQLEALLVRKGNKFRAKSVVMIQCVGSREEGHMYCSRLCCAAAVKNALKIKELAPEAQVYILYRDMRTYGFAEEYYQQARDKGVVFVRYDLDGKPQVSNGRGLSVTIRDQLLERELVLRPDLLVLSSRIDPDESNEAIGQILKVPLNTDRFFLEAHVKLRPVEFATEGVYVAGLAHSPKPIVETIAQAEAAAAKACTVLCKKKYEAEPTIATVNEDICDGCGVCAPVCDYGALEVITKLDLKGVERKMVRVTEALCKGCGGCVAACPSGAMEQKGFKNKQILAMIDAALEG